MSENPGSSYTGKMNALRARRRVQAENGASKRAEIARTQRIARYHERRGTKAKDAALVPGYSPDHVEALRQAGIEVRARR